VRIAVSDTGVGVPADALPHVFESFFTTRQGGRDLGLERALVVEDEPAVRSVIERTLGVLEPVEFPQKPFSPADLLSALRGKAI
jgi:hypothetical protein